MFPGATTYREGVTEPTTTGADATVADSDTATSASAKYVIVGAPLDVSTSGRPGTRYGPRRIRSFAEHFDDYDNRTGRHFSEHDVADYGDVRAWDDAEEYLSYLESTIRSIVWDEAVPIVLGGEHTVSLGGVRAVEPSVFVCLDAHLDLRTAYDDNPLSHACVTRRALDVADEVIVIGARTGSEDEWDRANAADVTVVQPSAVGAFALAERLEAADRPVYLSVDIDCVDPAFAPGTGTMEPFGLEPSVVRDVVRTVAPYAGGFDIVEVNDRDDGQAAVLAGKLVRSFVFAHADGQV